MNSTNPDEILIKDFKLFGETRIVRGSDYSPASELSSRVRKTMTGNNPKLDLVNVDACKKIRSDSVNSFSRH